MALRKVPPRAVDLTAAFDFTGGLSISGTAAAKRTEITKFPVRLCAIANIAVATAPNTVDGKTVLANDDILLIGQTLSKDNGVYNVDTVGTGANGVWTRAAEFDIAAELPKGIMFHVLEGDLQGGKLIWLETFLGVLGTDPLVFEEHEEGVLMNEVNLTGNGTLLNFDLGHKKVVGVIVFVDGIQQADSVGSIAVGAGAGGVDQYQFGVGNAPANLATVDLSYLYRV